MKIIEMMKNALTPGHQGGRPAGRPYSDGAVRKKGGASASSGYEANAESMARKLIGDAMPGYTQLFWENGITPDKIKAARDGHLVFGKLQGMSNLMDVLMEYDDNLRSAIDVRKSALKKAVWSYGVELSKDRQEFYDNLLNEYLPEWIDSYVNGRLYGWQFYQIIYEIVDGYYIPSELVSYNNLDLRIVNRKLTLFERDKPVELPENKFLSIYYKKPVLPSLMKYYVFYAYALNYWAQFVESYGKPLKVGIYNQTAQPSEVNVLRAAIKGLGNDQGAVISEATKIEFIETGSKTQSSDMFERFNNFLTSKVTKGILGQTLSTQEGGGTGSYALGKVHNDVREDIMDSDITDFRAFANAILNIVDAVNFGGSGVKVWFEIHDDVDLEKRIAIDEKIVNMGVPVSEDHFYDTYGIDRPTSGQKIVQRGAAVVANAEGTGHDKNRLKPVELPAEASVTDAGDPPAAPTVPNMEGSLNAEDRRPPATVVASESYVTETAGTASCSTVLKSEIAKHLSEMRGRIRACGSLKEVREIDLTGFIAGIGGEMATGLVKAYVDGRKTKRQANSAGLVDIRWEWDEESIEAAHAMRNQAMILSAVRVGESFEALTDSITKLLEEGGNFTDFIAQADLAGFAPDNPYQLKTEYETALAAAEGIGKWDDIQSTKALFPYLKYITMNDDLVRDEHAALDGTIAAVDDAFWDENYPPNGYNCRCTVEQLMQDEAEAEPQFGKGMPVSNVGSDFATNIGKTKVLPGNLHEKLGKYEVNSEGRINAGDPPVAPTGADGQTLANGASESSDTVVYDALNYPVIVKAENWGLDSAQVAEVLKSPTEVWQNGLFECSYVMKSGDVYQMVFVQKGRVAWSDSSSEIRGNYGVREV